MSALDSPYAWLASYFILNLTLTLYNKIIMQFVHFSFPWMLTALHTFCGTIGCYIAAYVFGTFKPTQLNNKENMIMIAFSVLYTINIVSLYALIRDKYCQYISSEESDKLTLYV